MSVTSVEACVRGEAGSTDRRRFLGGLHSIEKRGYVYVVPIATCASRTLPRDAE